MQHIESEVVPFVHASNFNRKYERKLLRFAVKYRRDFRPFQQRKEFGMNKALLLALNEHIYLQGLISKEMKEKIDIEILSEN